MRAVERESIRIVLDQSNTPDDALGRKLIAASATCAYFPPERPEIDICLACGFEGWGCVCDPSTPREEQNAEQLERARESRLTQAEAVGGDE